MAMRAATMPAEGKADRVGLIAAQQSHACGSAPTVGRGWGSLVNPPSEPSGLT
ncbi:hypothetical protein AB0M19_28765 [Streptomyces sp. NPDC051920]|uniref:hypothetical protein n=1 Tax=Streptomyces sp. NPDC051920 TaxID=3155523 RepID=UPI003438569F